MSFILTFPEKKKRSSVRIFGRAKCAHPYLSVTPDTLQTTLSCALIAYAKKKITCGRCRRISYNG